VKFEQNELPHPADVTTARGLKTGEIFFDGDGIPWRVDDLKNRKHNPETGVWSVPVRQAVYDNDQRGNSWITCRGVTCVRDFGPDELIPIYDTDDLIKVIHSDIDKYVSR